MNMKIAFIHTPNFFTSEILKTSWEICRIAATDAFFNLQSDRLIRTELDVHCSAVIQFALFSRHLAPGVRSGSR